MILFRWKTSRPNWRDRLRTVINIIGTMGLYQLKEAGFVVIHREPTENMAKAFYAKQYPESVSFNDGFHRMVAQSIREQMER